VTELALVAPWAEPDKLGLVDVSRSATQSFVEARASSRKEGSMGILWIILIVVVVLALLGFFGFRR
jgi:hypothetical protein